MLSEDLRTEFDSLLPGKADRSGATRRTALQAALGIGYAAAAMPVAAQTAIRTSSEDLLTAEFVYEVNGFKVPAYRAAPAGKTDLPVVLVVHEVFGVHEYIADTARRFARAGYPAIAPELFARQGDAAGYGELAKLMAEVVSKVPDAQVMADLDGAIAWAGANGGNVARVGLTGFCWGGRAAWLYAAHNPTLKAAVAWYGRLVGSPSELTPSQPLDVAGRLHAPVLGLYGGAEAGIPLDTVDKMKAALAGGSAAAKASQIVVYPDAPHAFHADYRPSFRAQPAEDGWKKAIAWFRSHGVA